MLPPTVSDPAFNYLFDDYREDEMAESSGGVNTTTTTNTASSNAVTAVQSSQKSNSSSAASPISQSPRVRRTRIPDKVSARYIFCGISRQLTQMDLTKYWVTTIVKLTFIVNQIPGTPHVRLPTQLPAFNWYPICPNRCNTRYPPRALGGEDFSIFVFVFIILDVTEPIDQIARSFS